MSVWRELRTNALVSDEFKEPLQRFVVAAGSSNASVTLQKASGWNPSCFSITAVGADIRWNIDAAATASTYYIKNGDTIKIALSPYGDAHTLNALRNASTDGTLEVIAWKEQS